MHIFDILFWTTLIISGRSLALISSHTSLMYVHILISVRCFNHSYSHCPCLPPSIVTTLSFSSPPLLSATIHYPLWSCPSPNFKIQHPSFGQAGFVSLRTEVGFASFGLPPHHLESSLDPVHISPSLLNLLDAHCSYIDKHPLLYCTLILSWPPFCLLTLIFYWSWSHLRIWGTYSFQHLSNYTLIWSTWCYIVLGVYIHHLVLHCLVTYTVLACTLMFYQSEINTPQSYWCSKVLFTAHWSFFLMALQPSGWCLSNICPITAFYTGISVSRTMLPVLILLFYFIPLVGNGSRTVFTDIVSWSFRLEFFFFLSLPPLCELKVLKGHSVRPGWLCDNFHP